ncbi:sporulation related protein [Desulfobotulus alkaliphilus]|uniref:Sporulation related protein n=1 Tax=Desulfobotulus alkaliphilus TaxID=622671 RepID=A0A562RHG8_9BACT|nr:SPOR domain-containing protein [Desulfobotulus alkaliphilus]TWI68505.1 sporulation related protein [Desulfobotulus alkaliphilus]
MSRNFQNGEKKEGSHPLQNSKNREWMLFVLFVSVCMFVLGILVGRGTSPVTFDIPDMEARLQSFFEREKPQALSYVPELTFFESLKHTEVLQLEDLPVKMPRFDGEKEPMPPAPLMASESPSFQARGNSEEGPSGQGEVRRAESRSERAAAAAQKPEEKTLPAVSRQQARTPAAPSSSLVSGKESYTIQVAAMKNPEDAARMVQQLLAQNYDAYVVSGTDQGGGVWYRVRVGRFVSRDAARPVLARLEADRMNAFVLRMD